MECFSCKENLTFKPGGLGFQDSPWLRSDLIHLTPGSVVSLPGRLFLFPLAHTHLLRATGRCPMLSWFAFLHSLCVSWGNPPRIKWSSLEPAESPSKPTLCRAASRCQQFICFGSPARDRAHQGGRLGLTPAV